MGVSELLLGRRAWQLSGDTRDCWGRLDFVTRNGGGGFICSGGSSFGFIIGDGTNRQGSRLVSVIVEHFIGIGYAVEHLSGGRSRAETFDIRHGDGLMTREWGGEWDLNRLKGSINIFNGYGGQS